jgi:fibronectin-binding autotransporter adhesin
VRASTLSGNVAAAGGQSLGGGLLVESGGPHEITNSTFAGNRAMGVTARGGAINTFVDLAVTNATIARNRAKIGGGIYVETGDTTLEATILGLNEAPASPDCGGTIDSAGHNLIKRLSGCMFIATPSDLPNIPPNLGTLGAYGGPTRTIPIRVASEARNAIPKASCAFVRDQRGVSRPQGPRCDIGAFERRRGPRP